MKEKLIKDLNGLITTQDYEERVNLHTQVSHLLKDAKFDLDPEREQHTRKLIINTVNNYFDTSDVALKTAIVEHLKTIESYLKD